MSTPSDDVQTYTPDDDDSDNELFEEMLHDRGPLVTVAPESVVSKQLEDTLRHIWGAIKVRIRYHDVLKCVRRHYTNSTLLTA